MSSMDTRIIHSKLNVPGLLGVMAFYVVIFVMGIMAACRKKAIPSSRRSEDVMLAGRNMNAALGVFTLTATWVGGDYVVGTAEYILNPSYGLIWCQAPIFFSLSLVLSGQLYVKKMWNEGYVTILDPLEKRFGQLMSWLLYIISLFGEVVFAAIALSVLGATLNVIVGLNYLWAVIISAVVSLLYTLVGGLSSVAYTDIIQLGGLFFGLWLAIPFALKHDAVSALSVRDSWVGEPLRGPWIVHYIDNALLLLVGAGPWQIYFQRILSQKNARNAVILSMTAGLISLLAAVAPVLIGAVAASTDWNGTGYRDVGYIPMPECDYPLALPLVLRFLTPTPVAVFGLAAVSAAAMSSVDSVILSTSTMFAQNIYRSVRNRITARNRTKVSDTEILWVLRIAMVVIAVMTTSLAITVKSVVVLINLCVDLPYVMLFPQLICALYVPMTNSYGSLIGYITSAVLRFTGGEPLVGLQPIIRYPWYVEDTGIQRFPYKTLAVIITFTVIVFFSWISNIGCRRSAKFRNLDRILFGIASFDLVTQDETPVNHNESTL